LTFLPLPRDNAHGEEKAKVRPTPVTPLALKADLVSALGPRFGALLDLRERPPVETLPTGVPGVEIPRGAITEVCGSASSGRTSFLLSVLASATGREEVCALVDMADAFDPASGSAAGIDLNRLLWVRCGGRPDHALKAADLLAHGGGFGIVALDLAGLDPRIARRIPLSSWYRLLRAVENTPTAFVILELEPQAKACAALVLEMSREHASWSGRLLRGARFHVERRKPQRAENRYVCVSAWAS
jgi:hypothetical protein